MINGTKKHDYLICIDSDGTIMDTMTIKHFKCFGPCFIETFNIKEHQEDILTHWNNVNLFEKTRGINRFQGLKEILEYVDKKYGITFEGAQEFYNWVDVTLAFSVALLKEETLKTSNNKVLKLAIEWSDNVNESIKKLPSNIEFEGCKETLKTLSEFADLLGVSSANKDAVISEWNERGLAEYFMDIACQDRGSKADIISAGLKLGYSKDKVIMLGDALGDLKAAKDNEVLFYPIIPTKEVESWKELNELSNKIKEGKYNSELENYYLNKFLNFLENGGK